jgi:hypothetical protein
VYDVATVVDALCRVVGSLKRAVARIRITRVRALAAAGVATVALIACEPLGPDELQREVESIHSVAAESAVLADQVAGQNTKRTFARVQARELSDAAEHSAERLTDAHPAPELDDATARAIDLAEATSAAVGEVELAPDDPAKASAAARRLRDLAARADALARSL